MQNEISRKDFLVPISIVIAGALIAGVVYFKLDSVTISGSAAQADIENALPDPLLKNVTPVSAEDHILGNPNAPIKLIEYSDLECIFCKKFHPVLKRIVNEYGKDGNVAWVYRHFPLDSIHTKARSEANATECVALLGGNTKFWQYIDKIFTITPANDGLEPSALESAAIELGIDRNLWNKCQQEDQYAAKIEKHLQNAIDTGGTGTPWLIVQVGDEYTAVNGALPYEKMKTILDEAIKTIE